MAIDRVWDDLLPDNTTRQISPKDQRDCFDSVANEVDTITVSSIRAFATDDAGDGTVEGDVNATDFSGQAEPDPAPNTYLHIPTGSITQIAHKGIAYFYYGPSGVDIGLGGDYVTTEEQFVAAGSTDHAVLVNRALADQHPISAITGLETQQTEQDAATVAVADDLVAHEGALDPHPQYVTPQELPQTVVRYYSAALTGSDYTLRTDPPVDPETALSVGVSTSPVLLGAFRRDAGLANDVLYANVVTKIIVDAQGASNAQLSVHAEVKLDQTPNGGSIIPLATSSTAILSEDRAVYALDSTIAGPVSGQAGDVPLVEIWFNRELGGGTDNGFLYVDGNGTSRNITNLPIPAYPAEHAPTHETGGSDEIPELATATVTNNTQDGRLETLETIVPELVFAAYGDLSATGDTAWPGGLDATWQKITILDQTNVTPKNITINTGSSTFSFVRDGIYLLTLNTVFEHDEQNNGRTTGVRFYNETDGAFITPLPGYLMGTGRNQPLTDTAITGLVEITAALKDKEIAVYMGGGDTYSAVVFNSLGISVNAVSEWKE